MAFILKSVIIKEIKTSWIYSSRKEGNIIKRLEDVLVKEHFINIYQNETFLVKLQRLFNQKTNYVRDGFFKRKVVKADFYKEELSRALYLNNLGHTRTVLVVNLKTGLTKLLDGAFSYQKSEWDFPILYLDELFEDLDPFISVTAEAKFPNFFDKNKTPSYNFEELEKFLNNLIRNWIHKNKDYLQNNKKEYLQKNLEDFILSKKIVSTKDFCDLFEIKQIAVEYSKFCVTDSEEKLTSDIKKLISILKNYENAIDDYTFIDILSGSLVKNFWWELSDGDVNNLPEFEKLYKELLELADKRDFAFHL